ncbi:substrate-binding periplasmic protein [Serpens gallinarum]|uniref:Transporter substrate-binding domain-containing protein n=1 Tax=Serpens gallinarum TaxID=2763075 RepID=A0ABR8TSU7_9PSED|nr:transporter substrate-binding domain-containing protein [Serpens gallinarum]MBD7978849.1 transporter substrate-binding domain-containing protein [Serpens gallinarum]
MPTHLSVWLGAMCLALVPGWALGMGSCERIVATGVAGQPPYLWQDLENPERLIGASADLVRLLANELGLKVDILASGTAEQAEQEVASGRVDLLINTRLSLPLLERMDFIHPPLHETPSVIWAAKGRHFGYLGRDDLQGRQGIHVAETLIPSSERFVRGELQLDTVSDLSLAWSKLLEGHADFLLYERYRGQAEALRLGLADELEVFEPAIYSAGLYLALSHASVCNEAWLRGQLAKKLTESALQETAERLLAENLQRWAGQQLQMDADVSQ